jgi:glycosyltransferase involved in cell wall biosynthesis
LFAKRITVVSRPVMLSFGRWLGRRMTVVPNPLSAPIGRDAKDMRPDPDRPKILLSVGRLSPEKNQACLLSAFARISDRFPDWRLRLVGEGALRGALEAQVAALGLQQRIELPGAIAEIAGEYLRADLFVLPSTYESFGLATAEALSYGLPAIGFADCPGTRDVIRHDENGKLVSGADREQALADCLAALMASPDERRRLSETPRDYLSAEFGIESVLDRWETVLADSCA